MKIDKKIKINEVEYFNSTLAKNFQSHVVKSVPGYNEVRQLIIDMSAYFITNKSVVYDLGCTNGSFLKLLNKKNILKKDVKYFGIDSSKPMIHLANKNKVKNIKFINSDITNFKFQKCDLFISILTTHFIKPSERSALFRRLYSSLKPKGAIILFEKSFSNLNITNDLLEKLYFQFKLSKGFTPEMIINKSLSLNGILNRYEYKDIENHLKRSKFENFDLIYKNLFFECYLAVKS